MKSDIFIWNLYRVHISKLDKPIFVCAPSMIGAIKRAHAYIRGLETKDAHEVTQVVYCDTCLN